MSAMEEEIGAFVRAKWAARSAAHMAKDEALIDACYAKFYHPDWTLVRNTGNLTNLTQLKALSLGQDIVIESEEVVSVDSVQSLAGGAAAVVIFTMHTVFKYKGTPNDDIAKYTGVVERAADGRWLMVHMHRCEGQKPA